MDVLRYVKVYNNHHFFLVNLGSEMELISKSLARSSFWCQKAEALSMARLQVSFHDVAF